MYLKMDKEIKANELLRKRILSIDEVLDIKVVLKHYIYELIRQCLN